MANEAAGARRSASQIMAELQAEVAADMAAGTPPPLAAVLEKAGQRLTEDAGLWQGGTAPMRFDEFCVALDKCPLFPRQRKVFEEAGWLDPRTFVQKGHSPVQELVVCWGKGCLAGDAEVIDYATGRPVRRRVEECAEAGTPLVLPTLKDGRLVYAHATPFVRAGVADLFEVTLEDGRSFTATEDHRCASGDGWVRVGDIAVGETRLTALDDEGAAVESLVEDCAPAGVGDFYDGTVPETGCYFDAGGVLHSNSGKDYLCAKLAAYVAFVLLSLRDDPARHFGIAEYSQLAIVNIAPTEKQARTIFFDYLRRFVKTKVMARFVTDPKRQVHADDILFFRATDDGQEYTPLAVWSMHSRAAGLEGKNVIFWVMDEADAFYDAADKSNAEELHGILRSSASTRFSGYWKGVVISYPRVEGGFMMRLLEKGAKSANYLCDKAATWDVNENVRRDSADIQADYDNDPSHAAALYECIPSATIDAFFEFPERIDAAVDPDRVPVAVVEPQEITLPMNNGGEAHYVSAVVSSIVRVPGHTYFLGGDAGDTGDAYALSVFHTEDGVDAYAYLCPRCGADGGLREFARYDQLPLGAYLPFDEGVYCGSMSCMVDPIGYAMVSTAAGGSMPMGGWWRRSDLASDAPKSSISDGRGNDFDVPHVYEDLLIRIKPQKATRPGQHNSPVYPPGVRAVCQALIQELNVHQARFDPYQTADIVSTLRESTGADVDKISFSGPDQFKRARLVKAMLYAGKLTLLPSEQRDREWKRLQRLGAAKIDHPSGPGEGKDLFDAESVAIWCAATSKCGLLSVTWT